MGLFDDVNLSKEASTDYYQTYLRRSQAQAPPTAAEIMKKPARRIDAMFEAPLALGSQAIAWNVGKAKEFSETADTKLNRAAPLAPLSESQLAELHERGMMNPAYSRGIPVANSVVKGQGYSEEQERRKEETSFARRRNELEDQRLAIRDILTNDWTLKPEDRQVYYKQLNAITKQIQNTYEEDPREQIKRRRAILEEKRKGLIYEPGSFNEYFQDLEETDQQIKQTYEDDPKLQEAKKIAAESKAKGEEWMEALSYFPRTPEAGAVVHVVGTAFDYAIAKPAHYIGQEIFGETHPNLAALTSFGLELAMFKVAHKVGKTGLTVSKAVPSIILGETRNILRTLRDNKTINRFEWGKGEKERVAGEADAYRGSEGILRRDRAGYDDHVYGEYLHDQRNMDPLVSERAAFDEAAFLDARRVIAEELGIPEEVVGKIADDMGLSPQKSREASQARAVKGGRGKPKAEEAPIIESAEVAPPLEPSGPARMGGGSEQLARELREGIESPPVKQEGAPAKSVLSDLSEILRSSPNQFNSFLGVPPAAGRILRKALSQENKSRGKGDGSIQAKVLRSTFWRGQRTSPHFDKKKGKWYVEREGGERIEMDLPTADNFVILTDRDFAETGYRGFGEGGRGVSLSLNPKQAESYSNQVPYKDKIRMESHPDYAKYQELKKRFSEYWHLDYSSPEGKAFRERTLFRIKEQMYKLDPFVLEGYTEKGITRAVPLFRGEPEKVILYSGDPKHQAILKNAYEKAVAKTNPDGIPADYKSLRNKVEAHEFNKALTTELESQGYKGILHSPGKSNEFELQMFNPKDVLFVEEPRGMSDPAIKRMSEKPSNKGLRGAKQKQLDEWREYNDSINMVGGKSALGKIYSEVDFNALGKQLNELLRSSPNQFNSFLGVPPIAGRILRRVMSNENKARGKGDGSISSKVLRSVWWRGQATSPSFDPKKGKWVARGIEMDLPTGDHFIRASERNFGETGYAGEGAGMRGVSMSLQPHGKGAESFAKQGAYSPELASLKAERQKLRNQFEEGVLDDYTYGEKFTSLQDKINNIELAAQESGVVRVMPLFGEKPETAVLDMTKTAHRQVVKEAYQKAVADTVSKGKIASEDIPKSYEQLKNTVDGDKFNKALTKNLEAQGWKGILHSPGRYGEFELQIFDPKNVLFLEEPRGVKGDPAIKRLWGGDELLKETGYKNLEQAHKFTTKKINEFEKIIKTEISDYKKDISLMTAKDKANRKQDIKQYQIDLSDAKNLLKRIEQQQKLEKRAFTGKSKKLAEEWQSYTEQKGLGDKDSAALGKIYSEVDFNALAKRLTDIFKTDPNTMGSGLGALQPAFENLFKLLGLGKRPKAKVLLSRLQKAGVPKDVMEATGWERILREKGQNELVNIKELYESGKGSLDVISDRLVNKGKGDWEKGNTIYGPDSTFSAWTSKKGTSPETYRENVYHTKPIKNQDLSIKEKTLKDRLEELSQERKELLTRSKTEDLSQELKRNKIDILNTRTDIENLKTADYTESHWTNTPLGDKNVSGHIRYNVKKEMTPEGRADYEAYLKIVDKAEQQLRVARKKLRDSGFAVNYLDDLISQFRSVEKLMQAVAKQDGPEKAKLIYDVIEAKKHVKRFNKDKARNESDSVKTILLEEIQPKWYEAQRVGDTVPDLPFKKQHFKIMMNDFIQQSLKENPDAKFIEWTSPLNQVNRGVPDLTAAKYYALPNQVLVEGGRLKWRGTGRFFKKFDDILEYTPGEAKQIAKGLNNGGELYNYFNKNYPDSIVKRSPQIKITNEMKDLNSVFPPAIKMLTDLLRANPNSLASGLGAYGDVKLLSKLLKLAEERNVKVRDIVKGYGIPINRAIQIEKYADAVGRKLASDFDTNISDYTPISDFTSGKIINKARRDKAIENGQPPPTAVFEGEMKALYEAVRDAPDKIKSSFKASFFRKVKEGFITSDRYFERFGNAVKILIHDTMEHGHNRGIIRQNYWDQRIKEMDRQVKMTDKEWRAVGDYLHSLSPRGQAMIKHMKKEAPTWKSLSDSQKLVYDWVQDIAKTFLDDTNKAREAAGKPPLKAESDYFSIIADMDAIVESTARKWGLTKDKAKQLQEYDSANPVLMDGEIISAKAQSAPLEIPPYTKIRSKSTNGYAVLRDPRQVMKLYTGRMSQYIEKAPAVAKINEMLRRYNKEDIGIKVGEGESKTFKIADLSPDLHNYTVDWLATNSLGRIKQPWTSAGGGDSLGHLLTSTSKNIAAAMLGLSFRSAIIQPTALINTVTMLDHRTTVSGLKRASENHWRDYAIRNSLHLKSMKLGEGFDSLLSDTQMFMGGSKLKRGFKTAQDWSFIPLKVLDLHARVATWLAAEKYAKEVLNKQLEVPMNDAQIFRWADDITRKTQATGSLVSRAPIQRHILGQMMTLFQTFTINQTNMIARDVLGIGNRDITSRTAALRFIKYLWWASFTSELYQQFGYDPPMVSPLTVMQEGAKGLDKGSINATKEAMKELLSVLPAMGSVKFGSSPLGFWADFIEDVIGMGTSFPKDFVDSEDLLDFLASDTAQTFGKGIGIPGTTTVRKMNQAEERGLPWYKGAAGMNVWDQGHSPLKGKGSAPYRP